MEREVDGISIKQVLTDGDAGGITIFSDGTKVLWGEGTGILCISPSGESWFEEMYDPESETAYGKLSSGMGDTYDWDDSTDRDMTRAEFIQYRILYLGDSLEEAEQAADDRDEV